MSTHIPKIKYKGKIYTLINGAIAPEKNAFTVIIGRNATGKSQLLSHITKSARKYLRGTQELLWGEDVSPDFKDLSRIVAITTTPFDRFPNVTKDEQGPAGKYKYLGYRERMGQMSVNSQLSKIVNSLVRSTQKSQESLRKLSETFFMLGFRPTLTVKYRIKLSRYIPRYEHNANSISQYLQTVKGFGNIKTKKTVSSYQRLTEYYGHNPIDLTLDFDRGDILRGSLNVYEDICLLMDAGFIVYEDLMLWRNGDKVENPIKSTSSGERCVLTNLLGIASEIENNCLVCIDEPEISLHPDWQEKYMELLASTFSHYCGCHFIIATHSPQIVSNLKKENCFIMTMDDLNTYSSIDYSNRSSDYQLAKIFKTPGHQNEYLMSEALELLTLISSGEVITDVIKGRCIELKRLAHNIDSEDPVRKLVNTLYKALAVLHI